MVYKLLLHEEDVGGDEEEKVGNPDVEVEYETYGYHS